MRAQLIAFAKREEATLAPYAAGAATALLVYADTALTSAHPSGQLDVALVMLAGLGVKAALVALQKKGA